nr:MAG TPA: hypothetical protein [Caudoviricetes sp.]
MTSLAPSTRALCRYNRRLLCLNRQTLTISMMR